MSLHPALTGILIEDILSGKSKVVAASRREPDSVSIIGGTRNTRGQFFIKIWRYLLSELAKIIKDTNRAFKAFESGSDITETYLNQIRQIIDIALRYYTINPNDKLLRFFLSISEEEWMKIENTPPDDLMDSINSVGT